MTGKQTYWFEMAEYDLETAKVMLTGKRFLYVGFMCHQVVEKALKGYFSRISEVTPPYTHNLTLLAKKSSLYDTLSNEQIDILDTLEPLNIEARYPTHKEKLLESLNEDKCKEILEGTENLFIWIKMKSS